MWLSFCNQCFPDNLSTSINGEKRELILTKCLLCDFTWYLFSPCQALPIRSLISMHHLSPHSNRCTKGVLPFSLLLAMLKITVSPTKLIQQNSKVFPSHIFPTACVETALIRDAATGLNSCLHEHS